MLNPQIFSATPNCIFQWMKALTGIFFLFVLNWSAETHTIYLKEKTLGWKIKINELSFLLRLFLISSACFLPYCQFLLESQTFSALPCCSLDPSFTSCHHGLQFPPLRKTNPNPIAYTWYLSSHPWSVIHTCPLHPHLFLFPHSPSAGIFFTKLV